MQIPQNESSFLKSYAPDVDNETIGFVSLETSDPSLFELALQPWELLARPKSAAPFWHSISMLRGENFLLYREMFSRSVSVIGLSPPGMLGIGVPLSSGVEAKYWGHVHGLESCPMTLPGPLNVAWEHEHQQIVALIEIDSLQASMSNREFEQLVVLAKARRADISPKVRNAFAMFMERTLKLCAAQPKLSENPELQRHTYEQLVFFLSSISRAMLSENVLLQSSFRSRGFQRAIEFLRESEPVNLTMTELCRAAEVSERTLQYAFKDVFDMSPQEFIIRRRLHSVRHALLTSDRRSTFVGQIAMDNGFFELGHFAGKYRQLFGELPSETLLKQGQ